MAYGLRPLVLVTGADGFVGRALCPALASAGYGVRRAVRAGAPPGKDQLHLTVTIGDLGSLVDWISLMHGVQFVIHLAARSHVLRERSSVPLDEYRKINVTATTSLARGAVAAGVKRLVFLSSIKVNGENTTRRPFTEDDTPRPEDPYGISKWEAEEALRNISEETGLETVVLRPPLVYGTGVKGNFLQLMNLISREVPLPLASVSNRRSLIYLDNLVDAIIASVVSSVAAGKTYLVSDGEDVSTPELVRRLANAMNIRARLLRFPVPLLTLGAAIAGKRSEIERLTGSLQVDSSRIRRDLGWQPPYSLEEGLRETARWFKGVMDGGGRGTGDR